MAISDDNKRLYVGTDDSGNPIGISLWEMMKCLGYYKRDTNGNRNLGMIIKNADINPWARYKPESYATHEPLTETQRGWNKYGFSSTPEIPSVYGTIGHAPLNEKYVRPTGGESSPYRVRDFDGYYKDAVAPIGHGVTNIRNERVIMEQPWSVDVNFQPSGWNATDCVKITDIVDDYTLGYQLALLIHKVGGTSEWLIPSTVKVSEYNYIVPIIVTPNSTAVDSSAEATIWSEMEDPANEGAEYEVAVVATNLTRQEDGTAYVSGEYPAPKSLEVLYGKDRFTFKLKTSLSLEGITGQYNTTWEYTTASDPNGDSSWRVLKPASNMPLKVIVNTPEDWARDNVYINVRITNDYGLIYFNGTLLETGQINIGKWVDIGASSTVDATILNVWDYPTQYWFRYPTTSGISRLSIQVTAWRNQDMTGESVLLDTAYEQFYV